MFIKYKYNDTTSLSVGTGTNAKATVRKGSELVREAQYSEKLASREGRMLNVDKLENVCGGLKGM